MYPSFDAAQGRFRLMPPQACKNQFLLDNIGRHSLMQTEGAWCWKFDDELFRKFEFGGNMHEDLARLRCRAGVIYGEDSYLFTQDIADHMFRVLDESVPFAAIPEAQHRLFLDQPATSSRRIGKRRAMKSAELNRMCVVPSRYGFLSA